VPRVVHFEIHAGDPERAIGFYSKLFGWRFQKYDGPVDYWLVTTGEKEKPGIDGGLLRRIGPNPDPKAPTPVIGYVCTIDVENVDATIAEAQKLGGSIALPKNAIPGLAWLAYARDPDGNIFGVYQTDPNAK
jgi:predicted enzyme related to lactoylglutathione lyase